MKIKKSDLNLFLPAPQLLFVVRAVLILFAATTFVSKASAYPPIGYHLIWSDEFNQVDNTPPNPVYWNYNLGANGWGNQELENYTSDIANCHVVSDSNATDGKALAIIELAPGGNNDHVGSYTSARINTYKKFDFQYGYVEARIQLPYGQGMWPTFWMLGDNFYQGTLNPSTGTGNWPASGEVDIMENIGNTNPSPRSNLPGSIWQSTVDTALHLPGHCGDKGLLAYYDLPSDQLFHNAYHLFAAQWTPGRIEFFVDGNQVATHRSSDVSPGQWVFDAGPFFLLLNVAVGGMYPGLPDANTSFPQTMLVDYVRVYQLPTSKPKPVNSSTPGNVVGPISTATVVTH